MMAEIRGQAFCWGMCYKKPILVNECDLLVKAVDMPVKSTIKTRLKSISYSDMVEAIKHLGLNKEFSYSGHGDIFEISRHEYIDGKLNVKFRRG